MKMALEVMSDISSFERWSEVRDALKAALAEPAQEPVGYLPAYELDRLQSGHDGRLRSAKFGASVLDGDVAVYTAPPQRPAEPDTDCHAQGICQRSGYSIN